MVYVRIIFLSLLAGAAAAGFVWYAWGMIVNIGAYRRFKTESSTSDILTEEPEESGE
jgi:hypothetical protein